MQNDSSLFSAHDLKTIQELGEGFLERYVQYAGRLTDAPSIFHVGCGFSLMSSIIGRRAFEPLLGSAPNLWILLLGPTTIYRKTTSLRIARDLLVRIDPKLLIASDFSPQALIAEFAERPGTEGVLLRDEVSGFFHSISRHDYMAGTKEYLIKLFDGDSFKRKLRREEFDVKDPYFVWLGGAVTDKLLDSLTDEDIFSGLMVRFILINPQERGPIRPLYYPTARMDWIREDLIKTLVSFRERLTKHWVFETKGHITSGCERCLFVLNRPALFRWNTFVRKLEEDFQGDPIIEKTNSRTGPLALKLMMLFAVDHWDHTTQTLNTITVDKAILLKSLFWANEFRLSSIHTLTSIGTTRRERKFDRVVDLIKSRPSIGRSEIMRRFKLTGREMEEVKRTLVERGLVSVGLHQGKRGPPSETYYVREEEETS